MKVIKTNLKDLLIIENDIFKDNRGFFIERFNEKKWQINELNIDFIQDNHSRSKPRVIRGMHMQNNPPQTKLVGVTRGSIIDVVVDLRKNSKTYGQNFSIELSDSNGKLLLIPSGFLHGFYVNIDTETDVLYKVDALYNPESEVSIKWNDPDLKINWPDSNPIISDRDNNAISLKEYNNKF